MAHDLDPGPVTEPYRSLAADYPGDDVYPAQSFRVEWGPIFHRGRLDGSARVLVIGQDPAESETIARRILVGTAGHRVQGLLAKLGIDRSYVMVNTFLYSVYGQQGGDRHKDDDGIAAYRNRWLSAIVAGNPLEAVIALGYLADDAWGKFLAGPGADAAELPYAHVTHPTEPESSSGGDHDKHARAIAALLANWNRALERLSPSITSPDARRPLVRYGQTFAHGELVEIPEGDMPPGLPAWMRSPRDWAERTGRSAAVKRLTITVTASADGA